MRSAWLLTAVGLVLIVLAGIVSHRSLSLSWGPPDVSWPLLLVMLALGLMGWAAFRTSWSREAKAGSALLVGAVAGVLLVLWAVVSPQSTTVVPGPSGSNLSVVARESVAMIDPIWDLSERDTSGLLAREHEIGCISADNPVNSLASMVWEGPRRLVITTDAPDQLVVTLDASGRVVGVSGGAVLGC